MKCKECDGTGELYHFGSCARCNGTGIENGTGQDNKEYRQQVKRAIINMTTTLIHNNSPLLKDWKVISKYIQKLENQTEYRS